ncbi:hypothetical protein D3C72_1721620 [compost metagenome]
MLRLQHGSGFLQGLGFLSQRQALKLVLLVQFAVVLLRFAELVFQRLALFFVLRARLVDGLLRLLLESLREPRHQRHQFVVDRFCRRLDRFDPVIELLEVAMNRGFRAGIAHFDAYGIDAGVFAAGEDRQPSGLNHRFIYTAACHEISRVLMMWYVPRKYTLYHSIHKVKC